MNNDPREFELEEAPDTITWLLVCECHCVGDRMSDKTNLWPMLPINETIGSVYWKPSDLCSREPKVMREEANTYLMRNSIARSVPFKDLSRFWGCEARLSNVVEQSSGPLAVAAGKRRS